jgi:hypothetical protein
MLIPPILNHMKTITIFFALLLFYSNAFADNVRFKAPPINGKLIANNIEMTDWQTAMSCHFNYRGKRIQSIRYPQTWLNKIDTNTYSLKIKGGTLNEFLPHFELLTCAYKLILIGKNQTTHQLSFGEIYLLGKESGVMSESELQAMQELPTVAKALNEKTKELTITNGKDGGIVEEN